MTREEAARILDPETSAKALREYGDGTAQIAACDEACRIAADVLRGKHTGEALTLEQLREMDGQPVWVQTPGIERYGRWVIVAGVDTDNGQQTLYCQGDYTCRDYGKTWLAYAYPPAHIDREGWESCIKCSGKCYFCKFNETSKCGKCKNHEFYSPMFNFCHDCGRPLTDEAWVELEKRLRG